METMICDKCGSIMVDRKGKFGNFWGCSKYPQCKNTKRKEFVRQEIVKPETFSSNINWSKEQTKILYEIENIKENILVFAGPGCGKTTTIVQSLAYVPSNKKVLFLAFNKDIVQEIESKIPSTVTNVTVKTLNALGFSFVKNAYPKSRYDSKKSKNVIMSCPLLSEDDRKLFASSFAKILSMLNANMLKINVDNINAVRLKYGIIDELPSNYVEVIKWIEKESLKLLESSCSFDEMLSFPSRNAEFCNKFDIIFVDEAQDLTVENIQLIKNCMHSGTFCVFVGDPYQSIYGFRGANVRSIEDIKESFNAKVLPLTITRRMPRVIVNFLNDEFPSIQLSSEKDGGFMDTIYDSSFIENVTSKDGAMVLCRFNAPLVKPCLNLIKSGYKAIIRGKDIGNEIVNLVLSQKCDDISDLIESLNEYYNKIATKHSSNADLLQTINDKIEVIESIAEVSNSVDEIVIKLQELFDDEIPVKYEFSSIHKAKGKECNTVYCLYPETWISKKASSDEALQQEYNAKWVGMTRSKSEMIFVSKRQ